MRLPSRRKTLPLLAMLAAAGAAFAAADAGGRWEGDAEVPGAPLRIVVDLARGAGGGWIGSVILPGRGVKGATLGAIAVDDGGVQFDLGAAFIGTGGDPPRVSARWDGDTTLVGEFRQAGLVAPLRLQRRGPAQVDRPPAGTAVDAALAGRWQGRYELGGSPREVTLTLANLAGGKAGGELLIVGKRTTQLAIDRVVQAAQFVVAEAGTAGIRIEGRWRDGVIDGQLVQGPIEAPLQLHRVAAGATP